MIAFPLDEDLLDELDRVRGSMNRSQFIREALAVKLGVDQGKTVAPDRAGKGRKPMIGNREGVSIYLNDGPSIEPLPKSSPVNYATKNVRTKIVKKTPKTKGY